MGADVREIRLVIPSRIESLGLVNAVAEELARELELDEAVVNAVAVSVVEAATNAIEHGNEGDPAKTTEVLFRTGATAVEILIRDQGAGFDPDQLPDPLAQENLFAEGGRGVHILRSFMDEVDFTYCEGRGMECRLVLNLPARDESRR